MGTLPRNLGLCKSFRASFVLGLLLLICPARALKAQVITMEAGSVEQCRHLAVHDPVDDTPIVGVEDLALDHARQRLFLSTYDRWKLESAVNDKAYALPQGAIYVASKDENGELKFDRFWSEKNLFPHGIGLSEDGTRLAVVARKYVREVRLWRLETEVVVFDLETPEPVVVQRVNNDELCRANDITIMPSGRLMVTGDRRSCSGIGALIENALGLKTGRIHDISPNNMIRTAFSSIAFANGIASRKEELFVASTRDNKIIHYDNAGFSGSYHLEGGPDNLCLTPDGDVIAALHRNVFEFGLYRLRWSRKLPHSRIVRIDTQTGKTKVLFEGISNPPGATAAVIWGDRLITGSATEAGLRMCKLAKE